MATAKRPGARKAAATSARKAKKAPPKKAAANKTVSKKSAAKKAAAKKSAANKTVSKKAAAKKWGGLSPEFVEKMRERLKREREEYLHSAQVFMSEAAALMEGREPGDVQFDEESGEGDTVAVERERDLALSAQARAAVEQIDAALARIDDGTYGVCVVSGLPIPKARLEAIPWAAERVEFKAGGLGRR